MKIVREIKEILATEIETRGLSLTGIAREIGVSQSTLWNLVYGKTENFGKLPQLAKALGIPIERLISDQPITAKNSPEPILIEAVLRASIKHGEKPSKELLELARKDLKSWIQADVETDTKSSLEQLIRIVRRHLE